MSDPRPDTDTTHPPLPNRRSAVFVAALLCVATFWVFAPLRHAEFLTYDDGLHVTANPFTRVGITWAGLVWALTNTAKWIPLTWMSHMLDSQLFGLAAGAHHLSGVALHIANSLLLFSVLLRGTAALRPSAAAAALFALHPLHVEAVAWISSRPHLVSTFFWLVALLAYVRYTERRTAARYAVVGVCMLLGLMSKGMVVTLPLALLLFDYWPLRRSSATADTAGRSGWALVREKIPLLLLSFASVAGQIGEQWFAGTLMPLDTVPLAVRAANIPINYAAYVGKMLWPARLAIVYPLSPDLPPAWQIGGAALGLIGAGALISRAGGRHPYLVTGWLWYLVTLVPVIGFFPIGRQVIADRYTYLPLIGLFIMLAFGVDEVAQRRRVPRSALHAAAAAMLLLCAAWSRVQVGYWHDGVTLFRHALSVTTDNAVAENNLGAALRAIGQRAEARAHFAAAVRINPAYPEAHNNLGVELAEEGQLAAAEEHFREAVRLRPSYAAARVSLGIARLRRGDAAGAREQFALAAEEEPQNATARAGLAQALEMAGQRAEALAAYEQAVRLYREELRLNPAQADAENVLGLTLKAVGQRDEARAHFAAALRLNPSYTEARYNLGLLLAEDGQFAAAEAEFRNVLGLAPAFIPARLSLGMIRLHQGDAADARQQFGAVVAAQPLNPLAHLGLAQAFESEQRLPEAIAAYREVLRLHPNEAQSLAALARLGADTR